MQTLNELLQPGIQLAAPLILAAIGGLFSYRAGVFNIALEGFMLVSAFFSVKGAASLGSIWLGLLTGIAAAVVLAAVMGIAVLFFGADEVIVGIALNLFAVSLTTYLLNNGGSVGSGFLNLDHGLPVFSIPGLSSIPIVKDVFNQRDPLIYVSWLSVPVAALVLRRTLFGMRLRAAGESALNARAAGVRVDRIKFASFIISGFCCGLAGAELALGSVHLFSENMTSGRGIIAFAAVIFGGGTPLVVGLASLMFGFAQALAGVLQIDTTFPPQFVLMTPYLFAIIALPLSGLGVFRRLARRRARNLTTAVTPSVSAPAETVAADRVPLP